MPGTTLNCLGSCNLLNTHQQEMKEVAIRRSLKAVSNQQRLLREKVEQQLLQTGDILALLGSWEIHYKPSVCVSWARTLFGRRPELVTSQTRDIITAWEIEMAVVGTKKAVAMEAESLRGVLKKERDPVVKATMLLLWASASRHGDLKGVIVSRVTDKIVKLQWKIQKSDRKGVRNLVKFIYYPWEIPMSWATYGEVYRSVKRQSSDLTVHSFRRGAATKLADLGYSHQEIGRMTLHTPTEDPHLAVRRYIDPTHMQPEGKSQVEMSKALLRCLFT